uniref:Uncharacterized protein n=1 Tax=Oryza sativa subsp. japonica TaxID=39947 RepID=Q8H3D1_ORYSJ|nr:hypothetical protein [Oryza sativa Japonica Group]
MDLDKSTSTGASLKKLQEDGALPGRGTMEREPGGIEPELVLGRMVAVEDYILCVSFSHLCEAYIGVEPFLDLFRFYYELRWMESNRSFIDIIDDLRVRGLSGYEVAADFIGLNSETVERRVGQVMISGPRTALPLTDIIGPLMDHQAAASLKVDIAKEASDVVAAAATTSGRR